MTKQNAISRADLLLLLKEHGADSLKYMAEFAGFIEEQVQKKTSEEEKEDERPRPKTKKTEELLPVNIVKGMDYWQSPNADNFCDH